MHFRAVITDAHKTRRNGKAVAAGFKIDHNSDNRFFNTENILSVTVLVIHRIHALLHHEDPETANGAFFG